MKRIVFLGLCFTGILQALPLVNPADTVMYTNGIFWHNEDCWTCNEPCWLDSFSMRFGFYGDYVFNRNLEVKHVNEGLAGGGSYPEGGDFIQTRLSTNAGTVCINFCDWIEAYAAFGVTNINWRLNGSDIGTSRLLDIKFSPSVSYTVGAQARVFQRGGFILGLQGQFFYLNGDTGQQVSGPGNQLAYINNDNAKYLEYQGALAASYNFESESLSFIPFIGIQFSGVDWNLTKINTIANGGNIYNFPHAKEQKIVGWTLGNSIILCDRGGVTAEARFANEKALHVSGQIVF